MLREWNSASPKRQRPERFVGAMVVWKTIPMAAHHIIAADTGEDLTASCVLNVYSAVENTKHMGARINQW